MSHCKWCFGEWKYRLSSKTGAYQLPEQQEQLKAYFNAAQVVVSIYQATPNASGTFPDGRRHLSIPLDPSSYPHGWLVRSLVIRNSFPLPSVQQRSRFTTGTNLFLQKLHSLAEKAGSIPMEAFWRKTLQGFTKPTPLGIKPVVSLMRKSNMANRMHT